VQINRPGSAQPPYGTPLDRAAPQGEGLCFFAPLNEGGGKSTWDLALGLNVLLKGTAVWNPAKSPLYGPGVDCLAVGNFLAATPIPGTLQLPNPISLGVWLRWNGTNPTALCQIFGLVTVASTYAGAWRVQLASGTSNVNLFNGTTTTGTLATLTSGKDSFLLVTINAAGSLNAYLDGQLTAGPVASMGTSPSYTATSQVYFGGSPTGAASQCRYYGGAIWNRELKQSDALRLTNNSRALLRPRRRRVYAVSAGATVSGSMGVTLAPAAFSGTGSTGTAGSMGITLAPDVFSGTAGTLSSGSMAKTLNPDVFAGSAAFATSATMAVTLAPDVFIGTSGNITVASMAATLAAGIFVGTATAAGAASSGSMDVTLAPAVFLGLTPGVVIVSATMAVVLNPDVFAGTANAYPAPAVLSLVDPDLASLIVTTADPSIDEADPDAASLIII
jgi:hypothetical protein